AGSWLLWGTQPDVSISTNNGATWTIISGTAASNSHLDPRDISVGFPGTVGSAAGNAGCNHRTTFNRFYLLGNIDGGAGNGNFFNWVTNDGSIWTQVTHTTATTTTSQHNIKYQQQLLL